MIERADLLVGLSFIAFVPRLNKAFAPPPPPPLAPLSLGTSGDDALSGKKIDKQIKTSVTYFTLIGEIATKLKFHFVKTYPVGLSSVSFGCQSGERCLPSSFWAFNNCSFFANDILPGFVRNLRKVSFNGAKWCLLALRTRVLFTKRG